MFKTIRSFIFDAMVRAVDVLLSPIIPIWQYAEQGRYSLFYIVSTTIYE